MNKSASSLIPIDRIERAILLIRGEKVMLDADLAALYGVTTSRLNEQFKRNRRRFPSDFAFQLTQDEFVALMSQIATSKSGRGGRRKRPWVFTEHGAVMMASVLSSDVAVRASVQIVRAFIRMRKLAVEHADVSRRLDELERKYDKQFASVFEAIRKLMAPSSKQSREIGYHTLVDTK